MTSFLNVCLFTLEELFVLREKKVLMMTREELIDYKASNEWQTLIDKGWRRIKQAWEDS